MSFFLCLTWRSIRCLDINMWSAVRDPFLKPIWNSEMTLHLFRKLTKRSLSMLLNNLGRQLIKAIPL